MREFRISRIQIGSSAILTCALLSGCQDYKFRQVCAETITEKQISRAAATPTPADILFVVDNSGSMADEQENLAANFDFFINQIAGSGDYRMAVVSTDQSGRDELRGFVETRYADDSPLREVSRRIFSDCQAVVPATANSCFLGPDAENRVVDTVSMTPAQQITRFQNNVVVGSCGSGEEQGLAAMLGALDQTDSNDCNEAFIRDDANLVIIFVTDEDDASPGNISGYVDALKQIKDPSQIRLAAIVGYEEGEASQCNVSGGSECGSLCDQPIPDKGSGNTCVPMTQGNCRGGEVCYAPDPSCTAQPCECVNPAYSYWVSEPNACRWCSYFDVADCCSALEGSRYVRFLRAMEAEIVADDPSLTANGCAGTGTSTDSETRVACLLDSICQDNFGATLQAIARDLIKNDRFRLDPPALNPAGVRVRLTGGRFPEGKDLEPGTEFKVDDKGEVLTLEGTGSPEGEDETVEVFYVSEVEVPTVMVGACGPQTSTTSR